MASSLCHSLVPHTYVELLSKRSIYNSFITYAQSPIGRLCWEVKLLDGITFCDTIPSISLLVISNIKSFGNRSIFLFTACFNTLVSFPAESPSIALCVSQGTLSLFYFCNYLIFLSITLYCAESLALRFPTLRRLCGEGEKPLDYQRSNI